MWAQFLPGFREIRAPLIAGYLWLVGVFLIVEDNFPALSPGEAPTDYGSLHRLADLAGRAGTVVGVSFVAYLLGSITLSAVQNSLSSVARGAVRPFVLGRAYAEAGVDEEGQPSKEESRMGRLVHAVGRGLAGLVGWLTSPLVGLSALFIPVDRSSLVRVSVLARETATALVAADLGKACTVFTPREVALTVGDDPRASDLLEEWQAQDGARRFGEEPATVDAVDMDRHEQLHGVLGRDSFERAVIQTAERRVVEEVISEPALQDRLLADYPLLYAEYDRHLGEQELRDAILLPFMFVAAPLIGEAGFSPYAAGLTVVALLSSLAVLFVQARSRQRRSGNLLAECVADGRISTPTLQKLETALPSEVASLNKALTESDEESG